MQNTALPNPLTGRRLALFPITTTLETLDGRKRMAIGGCDVADLAAQHGTPLYLFDEATLDAAVAEYRAALAAHYPAPSAITLAGKALLLLASAQWAARRGLWLDCTGAGELGVAQAAGFPRARTLVHGVNKSDDDLDAACRYGAVLVVDNLSELRRLADRLPDRLPERRADADAPALWLRVRPGTAVDTHAYRQTGQEESKFGLARDEVLDAVALCQERGLRLEGLHFHQGSHFHDVAPVGPGLAAVLDLVALLRARRGWLPEVISPGGGWGVPYHEDDLPHPPIAAYVRFVAEQMVAGCAARGLPLPRLQLEPGRSLVARGGVAVYGVGATKQSGARRWLLIDGGMADNPRPALYGARYSALPVLDADRPPAATVAVAGPFCESGDVLIQELPLPEMAAGEWLAVPVSGAYHLAMQSNYNGARRPAVLWLRNGRAHLVQRRETVEELWRRDCPLPPLDDDPAP